MRRHSGCGLALAAMAVLSLAACSEGGDIRELTGLSAPAETAAAQQARQQGIAARADSLVLSTTHAEVVHPDGTPASRWLATCSGTRCELQDPATGDMDARDVANFPVLRGDAEAIGSAHGITLVSETGQIAGLDRTAFGAWMEHGSFGLFDDRFVGEGIEATHLYALALGDLTDRPLGGSATWLGIMVGTPIAGDGEGDRLVGTAALNYDLAAGGLDAAFSGIKNIDRGRAHSVATVIFADLEVGPDGTFARGQAGGRIQGGFYGPGHAEAAGIFEQSHIVGAFGATRTPPDVPATP
ncbi:MAG: transferrin-binding protein-like solute binding protein [Boseongicola sp. SB0677_bin_26]|nr:transferrin-binding protein-like solute binding protein [Boseongicola sp. SB0665_bin_10]MYG27786.1 transferrin-binding protein-like solute binding protein [Boseongicola sp. SB0677_bin_26]